MRKFKIGKIKNSKINMMSTLFILFIIIPVLGESQTLTEINPYIPPPEPGIQPIVASPIESDIDYSKIDDQIESKLAEIKTQLKDINLSTIKREELENSLNEKISIELIFNKQITQQQIDDFLQKGGQIEHIFTHVSYGWTGTMALNQITELPDLMGSSLLGILGKRNILKHLDIATQNGRVRPYVWNSGYSGINTGSNRITIAILDTGINGSHTDLSGRQEYWKDWTPDNRSTAQDIGHHGTHVAGIATGNGTALSVNPSVITYMDLGYFPPFAGSFYPSPITIPTNRTSIDWTSNMRWASGNSVTAQIGHVNITNSGDLILINPSTSGTGSSIIESNTGLSNPFSGGSNRWTTFASKVSGNGTPEYAVLNAISYSSVGDGYRVFRGVAPDCKWAGFKVFSDNGIGITLDIGEALDDLVAQRTGHLIKIANLSIGTDGDPGIDTSIRNKVNTAASNGIVMVVSAGNDGGESSGNAGQVDDPGRAHYAITVTASSDINQLTDYSSHGFNAPGDSSSGDDDMKPDITAPGGSFNQSYIMSLDSNNGDSLSNTGSNFSDTLTNNYLNIAGTSMSAPFISGCAALVIQALQQSGQSWHFTGSSALDDVRLVKMLLLMTATETNMNREAGPSGNPSLNRGVKDINEGYGIVNADAAIEAASGLYNLQGYESSTFGSGPFDKRCWARNIPLYSGTPIDITITVPSTGDFDMYLYSSTPDSYGNPQILKSSKNANLDTDESISYSPSTTGTGYLVVKRVSGSGTWNIKEITSAPLWELLAD